MPKARFSASVTLPLSTFSLCTAAAAPIALSSASRFRSTSPLITTIDGKAQVIANGTTRIRGYDLLNGEILWECGGMTTNAIPTPVLHDDRMVYIMSGFRGSKLVAIDLKQAQGDITDGDAVVWSLERNTPYVPSPLLLEDTLYFLKSNSGILTAVMLVCESLFT